LTAVLDAARSADQPAHAVDLAKSASRGDGNPPGVGRNDPEHDLVPASARADGEDSPATADQNDAPELYEPSGDELASALLNASGAGREDIDHGADLDVEEGQVEAVEEVDHPASPDVAASADARSRQDLDRTASEQTPAEQGSEDIAIQDQDAAGPDEPTVEPQVDADQPSLASGPEGAGRSSSVRDAVRQAELAVAERGRRDAARAADTERYNEQPAANRATEWDGPAPNF
jgi:hypothetical protein